MTSFWKSTSSIGFVQPKGFSSCGRSTATRGWKPLAPGPSRSAIRPTTIKGILIAGTETDPETDPEPETSGDAGAAAFLHSPARLFATVATPDTTDDDHDDQLDDEAEVEAR
ncbi:hypothetical protein [Streptomyces alanosinicus]|uniref:Uncharacterized protein n=1 Tax=Streptomyces alanosinicus TaxID=68171 RepID=A0A918YSE0_9ACTN|nr:hypothetical protein GCM10010339_80180 [Streptomyces alanosinicus]